MIVGETTSDDDDSRKHNTQVQLCGEGKEEDNCEVDHEDMELKHWVK